MPRHRRLYGFVAENETVQLVTLRVEAAGLVAKASFRPGRPEAPDPSAAIIGRRDVWLPEAGGWTGCPVYARDQLRPAIASRAPRSWTQMDATTVILPGMTGTVEPYGNLILEPG